MKKTFILLAFLMPILPLLANEGQWHRGATLKVTNGVCAAEKELGKAVRHLPENVSIIYEAPEGDTHELVRSGYALAYSYSGIYSTEYEWGASQLVICDDGTAYLKNPISQYATDSYIVGHCEENSIVFDFPQTIYYESQSYGDMTLAISLVQYHGDETEGSYYAANSAAARELGLPEIDNQLVMVADADGGYKYVSPDDGDTVVGMIFADSEEWTGYADIYSEWKPFEELPVTVPDNLEVTEMAAVYGSSGHFVKVGVDGDDIYVKGLFSQLPESWIKGEIEGDEIRFSSGEYMGIVSMGKYYGFMVCTSMEKKQTEYGYWYDELTYVDDIRLSYNKEANVIKAPDNVAFVLSNYPNSINRYFEYVPAPVISVQPADMSYTPRPATDLWYYSGSNDFSFYISLLTEEGYLLNENNLYYVVYIDDEPYTFYPDEYMIEEEMTYVPVNFTDINYDFYAYDTQRAIHLYLTGFEKLGVKMYYFEGNPEDGKILGESELAQIENVGISHLQNDEEVISEWYLNLNGMTVETPGTGVYVKCSRMADGSVTYSKVMIR